MDFDKALEYLQKAKRIGRERGADSSVAIVDPAGHPVAMGGTGNGRPGIEFALGKARLAAAFRRPTKDLAQEWHADVSGQMYAASLLLMIPGPITVNPGGYPLIENGEVIGAIGVTGGGGGPGGDDIVARQAAGWQDQSE